MKNKYIGWLGVAVAVTTVLWIVLMMIAESTTSTVEDMDTKVMLIKSELYLYKMSYLNAGLLTFLNIMFMSALYLYCKHTNDFWSTLGFAFIPIYGITNLFAYLSQVFLVPEIIDLYISPATHNFAKLLLNMTVHTWPGSLVEAINGMAYALVGIPSIIFPLISMRKPGLLAAGGYLLMSSGILSILAFLGILISAGFLILLSVAGGIVFLISVFLISYHFLNNESENDT